MPETPSTGAASPASLAQEHFGRRRFIAACAALVPLLAACAGPRGPQGNPSGASGGSGGSGGSGFAPHPRLLVTAADWQSLAARQRRDPDLARFVRAILSRAKSDLGKAPVERRLEGRRLLGVSREFLRRSVFWSFAWRLTGERVYLDRIERELLAVAAFSDWNPAHFLDVAEMTTGLAIAYDWLHADLAPNVRVAVRQAIVDKGIAQARHGHKTFKSTHNWGQVCIGGMVLGALAVADEEPELAADLLAAAQRDAMIALVAYRPDGVYPEGPSYWVFGTNYQVLLIAALRSALGTDWGLTAAPGLLESAEFYAQSIGPTGDYFNFADGSQTGGLPAALVYLARERGQPALLAAQRDLIRSNTGLTERFAPLSALWWPEPEGGSQPPRHYAGQGVQPLAIWRTAWGDKEALWFAIKAGGANANHAHMDAGSFVLDWAGLRWAKDLGLQDYNSLEQRGIDLWNKKPGSPRWEVFRLGSEAHNTLTLDGQPHSSTGMATLTMPDAHSARIDLSPVLGVAAVRTAHFADDAVTLVDAVEAAPGRTIRWAMTTQAAVRLAGDAAFLTLGGKQIVVHFSGAPVTLSVLDVSAPCRDYDAPNHDTRQLLATAKVPTDGRWRLTVRFTRV